MKYTFQYLEEKLPKDLCNIVNDYLCMKNYKLKKKLISELKTVYEVIKYDLFPKENVVYHKYWTSNNHDYFCKIRHTFNYYEEPPTLDKCITNSLIFLKIIYFKETIIKKYYDHINYHKIRIKSINTYHRKMMNPYFESKASIKHTEYIEQLIKKIVFLKKSKVTNYDNFFYNYWSHYSGTYCCGC